MGAVASDFGARAFLVKELNRFQATAREQEPRREIMGRNKWE